MECVVHEARNKVAGFVAPVDLLTQFIIILMLSCRRYNQGTFETVILRVLLAAQLFVGVMVSDDVCQGSYYLLIKSRII